MTIRFSCPYCIKPYEAVPEKGGHNFQCRKCGTIFTIPKETLPDPTSIIVKNLPAAVTQSFHQEQPATPPAALMDTSATAITPKPIKTPDPAMIMEGRFKFQCPDCKRRYSAAPQEIGNVFLCRCGTEVIVPDLGNKKQGPLMRAFKAMFDVE